MPRLSCAVCAVAKRTWRWARLRACSPATRDEERWPRTPRDLSRTPVARGKVAESFDRAPGMRIAIRRRMSTLPALPPPVRPPPPPPVAISLADRVGRGFPPLACVRGFRYFRASRVEVSSLSEHVVDATVKGKRVQNVRVRAGGGKLSAGCTCSAKLMGPAACKHVWATLLEIDRRAAFQSLRSTSRVLALGALAEGDGPPRVKRLKVKEPAPAPARAKVTPERASARSGARGKR